MPLEEMGRIIQYAHVKTKQSETCESNIRSNCNKNSAKMRGNGAQVRRIISDKLTK